MKERMFRFNPMTAAVMLAMASPMAIGLAHAGAGVGVSTNPLYATTGRPTYYANSPAGIWTDWTGASHDSGTALRKFVDPLPVTCPAGPIPTVTGGNGVPLSGKCIPVAVPDTTTYPGSDYYEIGIVQYNEWMHADLAKATTLRGYVQLQPGTTTPMGPAHYLGPMIVANQGRPVRIKYTNLLPVGAAGNLFLPVDTTLMGAGLGPNGGTEMYTQNRAELHLHGGDNPWISDGTPHQWTTPAGQVTSYKNGASFQNVPDMAAPVRGSGTLFWPNGLTGRLQFYHDHADGITRLNVYAGLAAAYLLQDPVEQGLVTSGAIPANQIPLVIQDKTFVPKDIAKQDAKWDLTKYGQPGDLWFPHIYEANQDPAALDGTNPAGRWDYGPWFWPIFPATNATLPEPSAVPEAYMDTPVVNGTAYPSLTVDPTAYRFRILNATNDRYLNLGFYVADPLTVAVTNGGSGYTTPTVTVTPAAGDTSGTTATATATVVGGVITSITTVVTGPGFTAVPTITITDPNTAVVPATTVASVNTEVKMVPFAAGAANFPTTGGPMGTGWGQPDGRAGGVPDPATIGPDIIQIGSEGGILPAVDVIPSTPINYEYNRRSVTVLNVLEHGLYTGPAERADVVVDFSQFAGKTLILYNDGPAPLPGFDPRNDYYTEDPDQTAVGGAATTLPGFGPNTRTVMQIKVNAGTGTAFNLAGLQTALPAAYAASQPKPVVAESAYNTAFGTTATDNYAHIYTGSLTSPTFTFTSGDGAQGIAGVTVVSGGAGYTSSPTITISGGGGSGATAVSTLSVTKIAVTSGGKNYTSAPAVTVSGTGGTGATATATVTNGKVTAVTITNGGSGYTGGFAVTFTGGGGTGASAAASGSVTGVTVTSPGYGYTTNPTVAFSGGGGTGASATISGLSTTVSLPVLNKAIQELFDTDYGRMNATLGVELPFTSATVQTTIPLGYIDPATETISNGETQLWKITHNGVDTHPVHFHLVNVQVINRIGWDGTIKPPMANEVGWKETVKMNPLEDILVAVRAKRPTLPGFGLPKSSRYLDPTQPAGSTMGFTQVDPTTGNPATVSNVIANFDWEYVWHCHILGHEENDFMRPVIFHANEAVPIAPTIVGATAVKTATGDSVTVSWVDNATTEYRYTVERHNGTATATTSTGWTLVGTAPANATTPALPGFAPGSITDTTAASGKTYTYRVSAVGANGSGAAVKTIATP